MVPSLRKVVNFPVWSESLFAFLLVFLVCYSFDLPLVSLVVIVLCWEFNLRKMREVLLLGILLSASLFGNKFWAYLVLWSFLRVLLAQHQLFLFTVINLIGLVYITLIILHFWRFDTLYQARPIQCRSTTTWFRISYLGSNGVRRPGLPDCVQLRLKIRGSAEQLD